VIGVEERAVVRAEADAAGTALDRFDPRLLVKDDAALLAHASETADELRRVDERVATLRWRPEESRLPERRVDLLPDGGAVEEHDLLSPLSRHVDPCLELVDLVRLVGDAQVAGPLEVAVDAVVANERLDRGEVREALRIEDRELVGEVAQAVGQAVRQRCLAEAAVPAARPVADRLGLEDRDPQPGVRVGQGDRGPQAGEPGTHDDDVRGAVTAEWRMLRSRRRRREPVADRIGRGGNCHVRHPIVHRRNASRANTTPALRISHVFATVATISALTPRSAICHHDIPTVPPPATAVAPRAPAAAAME